MGTMLTALANAIVATCSDEDKSSLGDASTAFLASTESITLAIAEKQSALEISTGTTVSVGITTVAATTVNTAASTSAAATTAAATTEAATTAAATTAADTTTTAAADTTTAAA